ncbi:hypothetical protein Hamer_G031586 [Homarus americanus]|uniref:Uncharacterized protein n=1 Tax=Homarus americanus TaxID=6706 RepID=A0A8J5K6C4_HOMAM|nr:hypothetical protein Hamer_G031586 [Homarus americanus]
MAGRFLRCVHGKELLALKERLAAHLPNSAIVSYRLLPCSKITTNITQPMMLNH